MITSLCIIKLEIDLKSEMTMSVRTGPADRNHFSFQRLTDRHSHMRTRSEPHAYLLHRLTDRPTDRDTHIRVQTDISDQESEMWDKKARDPSSWIAGSQLIVSCAQLSLALGQLLSIAIKVTLCGKTAALVISARCDSKIGSSRILETVIFALCLWMPLLYMHVCFCAPKDTGTVIAWNVSWCGSGRTLIDEVEAVDFVFSSPGGWLREEDKSGRRVACQQFRTLTAASLPVRATNKQVITRLAITVGASLDEMK
ncbi:unnamed protein product [Acanthocheilonema viteae]|uniref:Uncharacterized protein n=1 Tax=Acanthocheilonema viteae TaxID=6277 RepID=A0A498S512_ACAVI|nr:unnamed protein product [Acanthocheilonema viteae]